MEMRLLKRQVGGLVRGKQVGGRKQNLRAIKWDGASGDVYLPCRRNKEGTRRSVGRERRET